MEKNQNPEKDKRKKEIDPKKEEVPNIKGSTKSQDTTSGSE